MSTRNKRIEALKQRFDTPVRETTSSEPSNNTRRRHSVYIDQLLMQRVDEMYKQVQHEIFPKEITKSAFMEQLMGQGLENIDKVKDALSR